MGIEPTLSAWKAEVLPLNYTRLSSFPLSATSPLYFEVSIYPPSTTWWRGEDSNLRRLSQQIYSLPPLTAREPLRDLQTVDFLSFDQDRQDFSAKFPSYWPIFSRPGARRGIRTPDLLILTHYCFRSRRESAFGVWTFSSPCRDH